jgi:hypothetical protein
LTNQDHAWKSPRTGNQIKHIMVSRSILLGKRGMKYPGRGCGGAIIKCRWPWFSSGYWGGWKLAAPRRPFLPTC